MQARDVMVREVATCCPSDDLNRAAQVMWERDCGVVPVMDERGLLAGVITDRDVCMAAYTKGLPLGAIRVADVMARDVATCRAEDPIAKVEATMRQHRVRRIPVTDIEGRLTGLVSLNDLALRAAQDGSQTKSELGLEGVARTLASICQRSCELVGSSMVLGLAGPAAKPAPQRAVRGERGSPRPRAVP